MRSDVVFHAFRSSGQAMILTPSPSFCKQPAVDPRMGTRIPEALSRLVYLGSGKQLALKA